MQQYVYQIKFRHVCEVQKRLVLWSGTEHYRYIINEWRKRFLACVRMHRGPTLQAILPQAIEKWTTR